MDLHLGQTKASGFCKFLQKAQYKEKVTHLTMDQEEIMIHKAITQKCPECQM